MKTGIFTLLTDLRKHKTRLLLALFFVTLALVVVNLVFVNINSTEDQIYTQTSSDLRVLSQEISQSAAGAIAGSNQSFERLADSTAAFDSAWSLINQGARNYVDSGIGIRTSLAGRAGDIAAHTSAVQLRVEGRPLFSQPDAWTVLEQIEGAIAYVDTLAPRPEAQRFRQLRATLEAAHNQLHQRLHRAGVYHQHTPLHAHDAPREH